MEFKTLVGVSLLFIVGVALGYDNLNTDPSDWSSAMGAGHIGWGGVKPRFLMDADEMLDECPKHSEPADGIPDHFDGRSHWKECPSLWEIRDQGYCLGCWAVAIASVLTDRYCIHSGGKKNFRFSEQDLLACASSNETGWNFRQCEGGVGGQCINVFLEGCKGGCVERAWRYLVNSSDGLVSGGPYKSQHGCLQYAYAPCDHTRTKCFVVDKAKLPEEVCPGTCQDTYSKISYAQDKRKVTSACQFNYPTNKREEHPNFIKQVQLEIMKNGPIVAAIQLYESSINNNPQTEDEVYYLGDNNGKRMGRHAIKIIGWGTQEKTGRPYWLAANSFNYYWGYRGFFKIDRGNDTIVSDYVNTQMSTGMPLVE